MATASIAEFVNKVSKEIALLLAALATLHAVAAPSIFSTMFLLLVAAVGGIGFGYFRESSYDISLGVLIGITYVVLFLIVGSLLIVDAVYCGFSSGNGPLVGCANTLAVYTGSALAVGTSGYIGQILVQG